MGLVEEVVLDTQRGEKKEEKNNQTGENVGKKH